MSENRIRIRIAQDHAVLAIERLLCDAEARGERNVTPASLAPATGLMSELCLERVLRRLVAQGRLLRPSARVAHWVIVPAECQSSAMVPPEYWLEAYFGETIGIGYYVGLLTAAACYGAAEPAPRLAHLMVERSRAGFSLGLFECRFHAQPTLAALPTRWHRNADGRFRVSSPELTALDLAKRQARRATAGDLKQVICRLFGHCSDAGMLQALEAAQNGDAAERLADIARQSAPHIHEVIQSWRMGSEGSRRAAGPG